MFQFKHGRSWNRKESSSLASIQLNLIFMSILIQLLASLCRKSKKNKFPKTNSGCKRLRDGLEFIHDQGGDTKDCWTLGQMSSGWVKTNWLDKLPTPVSQPIDVVLKPSRPHSSSLSEGRRLCRQQEVPGKSQLWSAAWFEISWLGLGSIYMLFLSHWVSQKSFKRSFI